MALTKEIITSLFPKVSFGFQGQYVLRYKRNHKIVPEIDIILATKDIKAFHQENLRINKKDYSLAARLTKAKIVNFFQHRGAKVHFNMREHVSETGEKTNIRYGVVEEQDLVRDLKFWETLCVSSILMRPHEIFQQNDAIAEA